VRSVPATGCHPGTTGQHEVASAHYRKVKPLELHGAMSLGRLWQHQGKRTAARQLLTEIYGRFTEGFDRADLEEAKVLLAAVG
jgi:hypothetical protein